MPASDGYDPSKGGFNSEKEAWEFVHSRSCESCRDSDIDMCAAEWDVDTHEAFEKCGFIINEDGTVKEEE